MLNTIKAIINQKKSFQEAADLLLENDSLDDSIILGESSDDLVNAQPEEKPEDISTEEEKEKATEDVLDAPVEPEVPSEEPAAEPEVPEENPAEELPTPVGTQTGEPTGASDADILSTEIDIASNTPTDTVPVAPKAAEDAVIDQPIEGPEEPNADLATAIDNIEQPAEVPQVNNTIPEEKPDVPEEAHIEGEMSDGAKQTTEEIAEEEPEPSPTDVQEESFDLLNMPIEEAIEVGGEEPAAEEGTTEEQPAEDNPEEAPDEDNEVTSAVKDKVEEISMDDPEVEEQVTKNKEDVMKKLANITKNIEDVKTSLLKS